MAHRPGGDLISALSAQLSRLGRDVPGARLRGRPQYNQSLGSCLCADDREAAAPVRRPHCSSVRIDETYVKIRGKWRYLYRAIDKHGNPIDFLLTAKRDLDAAKRFFRKMLKDEPLLSPAKIGTDGANTFPSAIKTSVDDGFLHPHPVHYVTKHLQQRIESDHFRVKKNMPKIGGFQSFSTARRTIAGFEAILWLKKGFGFTGDWTVDNQNDLLARLFGLQKVNKA